MSAYAAPAYAATQHATATAMQSAPIPKRIRVANPLPGDRDHISMRRAERLMLAGRAYMLGTGMGSALRILHSGERMPSKPGDMSACGYDERGQLRLKEIKRVPVMVPERLLTEQTKVRVGRTQAYRSGPVRRVTV